MSKLVSPEFQAMMHREAKQNKQTSGKGQAGLTENTSMSSYSQAMSYGDEGDAKFEAALRERMGGMAGGELLSEADMMARQGVVPQQKQYVEGVDPIAYRENPNSKLPPAILATLKRNQGLTEQAAIAQGQTSGIEQLAAKVRKSQPVVEQKATPTMIMPSGVDYTALKAIIKECLDDKFKEMEQKNLNEFAIRTIALKEGKIRLVDNKGNIYSAVLERTGNVNDRKK